MLDLDSFFPKVLKVFRITQSVEEIKIELVSQQAKSLCPLCRKPSASIHGYYSRTLTDLPLLNNQVQLALRARKFYCKEKICKRYVFTERFPTLIKSYARRTDRLDAILTQIPFSLSGEMTAKISQIIKSQISPDTSLKIVRSTNTNTTLNPKHIGVDDWSFKKGKTYGTLVCDLESGKPLALLNGRDGEAWLKKHPTIEIVCRDRSRTYAKADFMP